MSKSQERLEIAAKAVTEACRALVRQVKAITSKKDEEDSVDYKSMDLYKFKVAEMCVPFACLERGPAEPASTLCAQGAAGRGPHSREQIVQCASTFGRDAPGGGQCPSCSGHSLD